MATTKKKAPAKRRPASATKAKAKSAVTKRPATRGAAADSQLTLYLVIAWVALIGVFLGLIIYQIYFKK